MRRVGFTFVEVMFATMIAAVGIVGTYQLFTTLYEQLAPSGPWGGLRRYIRAEELLRAQAEGLRVLRTISPVPASNLVVRVAPASGYAIDLALTQDPVLRRHGTDGHAAFQQFFYQDVTVRHRGQAIGTLSLSTLRSEVSGQDEKIGL